MTATAENIRELHLLHQRAKGLRDLLTSAPKTLAARKAVLARRQADLEEARKALKDSRAHVKNREVQLQSHQNKSDELRVKLNGVKKQDEYNAILSQLALDKRQMDAMEGEILEAMEAIDVKAEELKATEAEVKALADEVDALARDIEAKAGDQRAQLAKLETAIVEAEGLLPEDQRDQYRRVVKQRAADALAAVEEGACTGCFVSTTPQMMNELINADALVFCKSCGRLLYLAEQDTPNLRRSSR